MGGSVDRESLSTFSYELPIGQLKVELNSNIIPIGKIQTGIYYHRALLFKVILAHKSANTPDKKTIHHSMNCFALFLGRVRHVTSENSAVLIVCLRVVPFMLRT